MKKQLLVRRNYLWQRLGFRRRLSPNTRPIAALTRILSTNFNQNLLALSLKITAGYFLRMWSAVVNRNGVFCSVIRSSSDAWPGSRSIAIAKASTANDFSNSLLALSTANLYSFTQPANSNTSSTIVYQAGSLYGLNDSNPFNPAFQPQGTGVGQVPGGIITFGGGVALYKSGQVIGGLGESVDTACPDHAIAFRMRAAAGLNGTPSNDKIVYLNVGELPHDLGHPHCKVGTDITP